MQLEQQMIGETASACEVEIAPASFAAFAEGGRGPQDTAAAIMHMMMRAVRALVVTLQNLVGLQKLTSQ